MENVFLHLLNMSLTAAVLVVVVLLLRLVFHKAPRWIHCLLWALVAVRLLCPFTIESDLSLMPSTPVVTVPENLTLSEPVITPNTPSVDVIFPDTPSTPVPPQTNIGGTVTTPIAPTLPDSSVAAPGDSVDPWQIALTVATQVWLLGALAMLIYAVATTVRLRLQVREAVRVQDNLWQCDHLRSPFILGVLRPRIYLPSDLDSTAQASVIAHEKAHLRRLDHLWKPLGFLLLAVYWFNPILWVAYIFLCRDIEAACDEQVVRDMTAADRKAYSEALLACSAPRRLVSACPLAFGETSVKSRIKSVLSYKKPTIWIIVAALLVSIVAGVCLLTDRPVAEQEPDVTDKSTYAVFVHSDRPMAQIRLEMDGTHCTYTPSTLSSATPAEGTYVTEEDRITLTFADPDMILVFKGDFTGLTFCDEDSRYQEEYLTFGGYTLPDGAVFVRRTDNSVSDEDDTSATAKTAPVGLAHVIRTGLDDEDLEQHFGSSGVQKFHSQEELLAFLTPRREGDQEWLGVQWEVGDFEQFDDVFFAENVLLLTHHTTSSGMFTPEVVGYTYSEDGAVLTVEFVEYHPSFVTDDMGNWLMFSGIRKTDLEGVTELKAHFSRYIPTDHFIAVFAEPTEHPDKAVEKWRRWLPADEAWALKSMLGEWDDSARWGDAQSVDLTFTTAINLHGHTHYFAPHYSALLRDDGALLWLNEEEGAFLRWIAAYYDEENEELLYLASSHPTSYDRRYAAAPVVLNSPELKAIVNSNRWEEAFGDVSSYGRFTLGGTVYHIDRPHERIVYANYNNTSFYAVYLTVEELALVDGILASTVWAHTDYMVGKVTQVSVEDDYVTLKLTDSSRYTSDISDGIEVRVSLRYYVGEMPTVGSRIRVTYDGCVDSYYDGERYHPLIYAHSVTVTSGPAGTTALSTGSTAAKPTTPTANSSVSGVAAPSTDIATCVDGNYYYFVPRYQSNLYRRNLTIEDPSAPGALEKGMDFGDRSDLRVSDGRVYYIESGCLYSCRFDGSDTRLVDGDETLLSYDIAGDWIFSVKKTAVNVIQQEILCVYRKDGSQRKVLTAGKNYAHSYVTVYGFNRGKCYYYWEVSVYTGPDVPSSSNDLTYDTDFGYYTVDYRQSNLEVVTWKMKMPMGWHEALKEQSLHNDYFSASVYGRYKFYNVLTNEVVEASGGVGRRLKDYTVRIQNKYSLISPYVEVATPYLEFTDYTGKSISVDLPVSFTATYDGAILCTEQNQLDNMACVFQYSEKTGDCRMILVGVDKSCLVLYTESRETE